jgi:hypothetical protein
VDEPSAAPVTRVRDWLPRMMLLGSPLALAILEVGHPTGVGADIYRGIARQADWWLVLHLVQLPLFALVALSITRLINATPHRAATLSRVGMCIFVVFGSAQDAISGIATGLLVQNAMSLPPEQQTVVAGQIQVLFSGPVIGQRFSLIDLLAGGGWLLGLAATASALADRAQPAARVLLLLAGSVLFVYGHAPPGGPVAFGCVFIALIALERRRMDTVNRSPNLVRQHDAPAAPAPIASGLLPHLSTGACWPCAAASGDGARCTLEVTQNV